MNLSKLRRKPLIYVPPPPYEPKPPFPGRFKKELLAKQKKKFLDIVDKVEITIPLLDAIESNPKWSTFFKDLVTKRGRMEKLMAKVGNEAIDEATPLEAPQITKTLTKKEHPGKFVIPCSIGGVKLNDALCDSGAFVNVISSDMVNTMGLKGMKPNSTPLVFGDTTRKQADCHHDISWKVVAKTAYCHHIETKPCGGNLIVAKNIGRNLVAKLRPKCDQILALQNNSDHICN